jgi:uncharacterized protein YgbK (DUF1537 family)
VSVVRIVADDLTGALDAAAPLVGVAGPLPVRWHPFLPQAARQSFVLDTESREATGRYDEWLDALRDADLAFKKIDSLLRGCTVDEVAASLQSGVFASAVIAPAFPPQQRITKDGRQLWRARPSDEWQPVACDLMAELRHRGLPIRPASSGSEVAGCGFFFCDAKTEEDLEAIVRAGRCLSGPVLWVGSAGLARALAGTAQPAAEAPLPAPALLVIGSHHPVTLAQVEQLGAQAGEAMIRLGLGATEFAPALDALAAALATRGCAALVLALRDGTGAPTAGPFFDRVMGAAIERLAQPRSLIATGGATLFRLVRALCADGLLVTGELMPGIARSRLEGGRWPGTTVISKSGAFGAPDLLVRWWRSAQH